MALQCATITVAASVADGSEVFTEGTPETKTCNGCTVSVVSGATVSPCGPYSASYDLASKYTPSTYTCGFTIDYITC